MLFFLTRLGPIINKTVPYTYDQGRDFLKTAEVILFKNPTFIGPTTGIMGLYHGAWWYYFLSIPFILFSGLPISFYYFIFFIQFISLLVFVYFCIKHFSPLISVFAALLIVLSPYFIFTSFFVGNNIMVLPCLMAFLLLNYLLVTKKEIVDNKKYLIAILLGLFLGLVSEFELSFGLFLIPAFFITATLFKVSRKYFLNIKNLVFFLSGLLIAFTPRILFELKYNFQQTKILLNFFFQPKLHNPKAFVDVFKDRVGLFKNYFTELFPNQNIALVIAFILIVLVIVQIKQKKIKYEFKFFGLLLLILFCFTLLYKDNFWANYYEGIHYLFLLGMLIILNTPLLKPKMHRAFLVVLIFPLLIIGLFKLKPIATTEAKNQEGLIVQAKIVEYIQKNSKNDYCVKIYTPPVIPHTYNYLFLYQNKFKNKPEPKSNFVNNECWYIIEKDDFKERQQIWIKENIPQGAQLLKTKTVGDVKLELWQN